LASFASCRKYANAATHDADPLDTRPRGLREAFELRWRRVFRLASPG
jgi:hypothetical protein